MLLRTKIAEKVVSEACGKACKPEVAILTYEKRSKNCKHLKFASDPAIARDRDIALEIRSPFCRISLVCNDLSANGSHLYFHLLVHIDILYNNQS
jgi:hypothetical protein